MPSAPPLPTAAPPRRWWPRPRISLRGLMILVLVVAAPVAWVANKVQTQRRAIAAVRAAGGWIEYDFSEEQVHDPVRNHTQPRTEPAAPAWLRRWAGDELFQEVRAVRMGGRATPEALAALAEFDHLEKLDLNAAAPVGGGLGHLRGLRRLRTVWLGGPGIDDATLADVAALAPVRDLWLGGTAATDAGFARLAGLPAVTRLTVGRNAGLTDPGLARLLAGLPRLRDLTLPSRSRPFAATLAAVAEHHPDLARLDLAGSGVRDADLAAVGRIVALEELDLKGTAITGAGLAHLAPLARLKKLSLAELTGLADADLAAVGRIAALEDLNLGTTYIGDAGLPLLEPLRSLKSLDLTATDVTDAGLAALLQLPALGWLNLNGNPQITDAGIAVLARSPSLGGVQFGPTGTTQAGQMSFFKAGLMRSVAQSFGAVKRLPTRTPSRPGS